MPNIKEKTTNGMFWGGIMSLLQQVLGLVFSLVIARQLNPADYGMVGMLTIFTAVATCLQDGGFVWALTNRKEVTPIQYSSVFWLNVFLGVFIYTILFLCAPLLASFFGYEELVWLSRYVFLGIIFSSLGVVQTAFLYKQIKVKERAISTITGVVIAGIVGIVLAYNGFSYWGIATQGILNIGVSSLMLWYFSSFRPKLEFDLNFIKKILSEGVRFVIPNVFAIVGDNIFSLILGKKYSVNDVGNFTQASKWNTAGYSIILGMMRNVSQPVLVKFRDEDEQYLNVFRKLFRMTAFLLVPIMLGIAMVAPEFIEIILTAKWLESANILRILCVGGVFSVLNSMATYFIMSLNRTTLYMCLGVLMSVAHVVAALFASAWGAIALAYAYTIISCFSFIIYYAFIRQTHSYTIIMLIKDLLPVFLITLTAMFISCFMTKSVIIIEIRFVLRLVICIISYLVLMRIYKYDSLLYLKEFIINRIKR